MGERRGGSKERKKYRGRKEGRKEAGGRGGKDEGGRNRGQERKAKGEVKSEDMVNIYTDFKFCLLILHTHPEGTMSQTFYLGLGFYFMSSHGKHFTKFVNIIF